MRTKVVMVVIAGALCGVVGSAAAQQAPPKSFAFSAYYRCNQGEEDKADSLVKKSLAAIYDRHMAAGELSAWGWNGHLIGGNWRRVGYFVATTRDQLLDTRAKIIQETQALAAKTPAQNLGTICPSHDDYIWAYIADADGSPPGTASQPVRLATYYQCDMSKEARADEIFQTVLAPIYTKHMKAGHFASWAWNRHDIGGRVRRLSLMDGPDAKTVLNAWDMVFQEAAQTAPLAFQEFLSICPAHDDYVWNRILGKP